MIACVRFHPSSIGSYGVKIAIRLKLVKARYGCVHGVVVYPPPVYKGPFRYDFFRVPENFE
jgi:hypothetical protein